MLQSLIIRVADFCVRYAAGVIVVALLLAGASTAYTVRHFAIDTDINDLLSTRLPWRQHELQFRAAFPQMNDFILAVVDAPTAESSEGATQALIAALAARPDVFRSVEEQGGGEFFRKNGLLFLPTNDVSSTTSQLATASPLIGSLARDPSLRGSVQALSLALAGVKSGRLTLDNLAHPLTLAAATLEDVEKGWAAEFSWKFLLQDQAQPTDLRHLIEMRPVLDDSKLEPGQKATEALRSIVDDLGLTAKYRATVRLTGPVPISDGEFASLREGMALNSTISGLLVIAILWLGLRSWRLVAAVAVTLAAGLAVTAAVGLLLVGALNPISVAFAMLFVGLGADFAVQFSVRYRAQRHEVGETKAALCQATKCVGIPLTLAAGAAAAGFLSFLPTDYTGLAQLGIIAGCGMIVAYVESLTLLPALIRIVKPPDEPKPLTLPALAPADAFLRRHRFLVVGATAIVVIAGLPSLTRLQFDFNPLDLRDRNSEPIATLLQLGEAATANTAEVLVPTEGEAADVAKRLGELPEVANTRTLASFIPPDQGPKLAAIHSADQALASSLRAPARPAPNDADTVAALMRGVQALEDAADEQGGAGADAARRLSDDLTRLAQADAAMRERATVAFVRPLQTDLDDLRATLEAQEVTRASLPADLVRDWIAPDGRARVEAVPKGDANDNDTIIRFARAVLRVDPNADGQAVELLEWGDAMLRAFLEAGMLALCAIAILLLLVLRRVGDMLVTLIPLVVAALVTLEVCALTHFALNYANIIALPVLLGIGVAFKIYYVTAWRRGQINFLQSALTRAVFFSTLLTAVAFGSLWFSNNPGISSMGKLLALSLLCTLASAALFQPALMGEPRRLQPTKI
jgi:hopanoid biosynthesis associated RND transporter like protein HpnN